MHELSRSLCKTVAGQILHAGGVKYELLGKIGDGAAGIVRKAKSVSTGRIVAIKFLAPDPKYIDPSAFDEVQQRFEREGRRAQGLDHDNLVKIIAYEDNANGANFERGRVKNPFIVMEYVRGKTLESLIRHLAEQKTGHIYVGNQTLAIAAAVCRALTYLHEYKIVHRDVKPANVFLSSSALNRIPSVIKLGDFGVTKWGDFRAAFATGTLTASHQQGLGTIKYMSPEQAVRPKDVTVRSDMFSLGITLFELFTGQILPSPHHIFEIMSARSSRGNVVGKLYEMGIKCAFGAESNLFELILDMFLTNPKSRPSSEKACGVLKAMLTSVQS
jgi:serine/threonine protein kinase